MIKQIMIFIFCFSSLQQVLLSKSYNYYIYLIESYYGCWQGSFSNDSDIWHQQVSKCIPQVLQLVTRFRWCTPVCTWTAQCLRKIDAVYSFWDLLLTVEPWPITVNCIFTCDDGCRLIGGRDFGIPLFTRPSWADFPPTPVIRGEVLKRSSVASCICCTVLSCVRSLLHEAWCKKTEN